MRWVLFPLDRGFCRLNNMRRVQTILGPEKGLWVNPDIHEFYTLSEEDIRTLCAGEEDGPVLILSLNTWLYLSAERDFAAYSAWLEPIDAQTVARLKTYYARNGDKWPSAIYIDRDYAALIPDFEAEGYRFCPDEGSDYARILRR